MPGNNGYRIGVGWRAGKKERKGREGRKGNRMGRKPGRLAAGHSAERPQAGSLSSASLVFLGHQAAGPHTCESLDKTYRQPRIGAPAPKTPSPSQASPATGCVPVHTSCCLRCPQHRCWQSWNRCTVNIYGAHECMSHGTIFV